MAIHAQMISTDAYKISRVVTPMDYVVTVATPGEGGGGGGGGGG